MTDNKATRWVPIIIGSVSVFWSANIHTVAGPGCCVFILESRVSARAAFSDLFERRELRRLFTRAV